MTLQQQLASIYAEIISMGTENPILSHKLARPASCMQLERITLRPTDLPVMKP